MDRNQQLDAIRIQLLSQRPRDMWHGMEQIRQWLKENPEDSAIYHLLTDSVYSNKSLRSQIHDLLLEMTERGSKSAFIYLSQLPEYLQDLQVDADDAYYAGEYNKALDLYQKILKLEPSNLSAIQGLDRARKNLSTENSSDSRIPRSAMQFFRRARSEIAAKDYKTALTLLKAALEDATYHRVNFVEAQELVDSVIAMLAGDSTTDAPPPDGKKKKNKR